MDLCGEEAYAGFELYGGVVELIAGRAKACCFISEERAIVSAEMCDIVVLPAAQIWAVVAGLCRLCHCCSKRQGQQQ